MGIDKEKKRLRRDLAKQSPMKKGVKERWLAALRSGKYKQGQGYLRQDTDAGACHCCIGVLAEEELEDQWVLYDDVRRAYCLSKTRVSELLTEPSVRSLHLEFESMQALSTANDRGLSFGDIADAIEECL